MNSVLRRKTKVIPKRALLSGAMAAIAVFAGANANAASVPFTFAQFEQSTTGVNANQFVYTDNGAGADATLSTASVSIPVTFTFLTLSGTLPSDLQGPQSATLTLTSSTKQAVSVVSAFGRNLGNEQIFGDGSETDTLTITRDTPAAEGGGTMTNLLTMTFTGGLMGYIGDRTPSLSGNTNEGDTVTYSSDFITISPTAANDFNMAFTSWTSDGDGGGLEQSGTKGDSFFASATAAASSTFDSTLTPVITSVPEPGIAMFALSGGVLILGYRRRRPVRS